MNFPKALVALVLLATISSAGWLVFKRLEESGDPAAKRNTDSPPAPVEVAPIRLQSIQLRRKFTGTLDANAAFVVASKVGGRIEEISVDLGDTVRRGQVVARLDNAEYIQALNQVRADFAVARANLAEAESQLEIAQRELERINTLQQRGVSSESASDTARATHLARTAHVEVTQAQVSRAEAELETARIRLSYSDVTADWRGGGNSRAVAERYFDEGETVAVNQPLLKIVELDPLIAVFFVTERDYGRLATGQTAMLSTDAFSGETFSGRILRISPVFDEATRQARVEVRVDNPGHRLKPGMFIRVNVELDSVDWAVVVPEQALVTRDGATGVFMLSDAGDAVIWRTARIGIRQDGLVQLDGEAIQGSVVVLGQQFLDDGSPVSVVNGERP